MKSSINFMIKNKVASNVLMFSLIIFGIMSMFSIKKEVFPEITMDSIQVSVVYQGASADDIEKNIIIPIENELKSITGITDITSNISEGSASISVEVTDLGIKDDIESAINSINNFPENMEDIKVNIPRMSRGILTLMLYGNTSYTDLKKEANELKYVLESLKEVSKVNISGLLKDEVQILFDANKLKEYNLSISEVGSIIQKKSIDLSGGEFEKQNENVLIKVDNKKYSVQDFENLVIVNGTNKVYLKDIAKVKKGFEDNDIIVNYNGNQSIKIEVYRGEDSSPVESSASIRKALDELHFENNIVIKDDKSEIYNDRMSLLLKNALFGVILILIVLGIFLEFRLALWIASGMAVSFIGAFIFINLLDLSINMISMFAFILALGIVVDDAIIAGENIYEYRQKGYSNREASLKGIETILMPLTFAILTNIIAFSPLLFVSGTMGKFFIFIPAVISIIFIISWIEVLYILPNHLSYKEKEEKTGLSLLLFKIEKKFAILLDNFIYKQYKPFLIKVINLKYITISFFVGILIISFAYVQSGRLGFSMFPTIESDYSVVSAKLKTGATLEQAKKIEKDLIASLKATDENYDVLTGYDSKITPESVYIMAYLKSSAEREINTSTFTFKWRELSKNINFFAESMTFKSDVGGPGGGRSDITIELSSTSDEKLKNAVIKSEELLKTLNVSDIDNDFSNGKKEYVFELNEKGVELDLSIIEIAESIRNAFYGKTIQTHFEGENEVEVVLELEDKKSFDNISLKINNQFYYLRDILNIKEKLSPTSITRENGRKIIKVVANTLSKKELTAINNTIETDFFPIIEKEGVKVAFSGKEADRRENMKDLYIGFLAILLVIYILLTIPLESYTKPLIIMGSIPFSIIGAFIGHYIMGFNLSLVSMFGIVALAGVVINDSLVLIDYYNQQIKEKVAKTEAIINACTRRFRPILLTTVTTFVGVMPMIFETSRQAKFLIPMALSLGFGIVFATFITLVFIPALLSIQIKKEVK